MRVISHLKYNKIPVHDNLYYYYDWSIFENSKDEVLKNVDFHIVGGISVDETKIDKSKINVAWALEYPNGFWSGRKKGINYNKLIRTQSFFDIVICQCFQTCNYFGKKFVYFSNPVDIKKINNILKVKNINNIKKEIDVFMCGNSVGSNIRGTSIPCPVHNWSNVISKFNHVICNAAKKSIPWEQKQMYSFQSKISVVWADFLHLTYPCNAYAQKNLSWYKFKKLEINKQNNINVIAHPKMRIYDAAMSKSIILCAKTPFYGCEYPYSSSLEGMGLIENKDFIFFENCNDLEDKINNILKNYETGIYQKMIDSAYNKINENFNLKSFLNVIKKEVENLK